MLKRKKQKTTYTEKTTIKQLLASLYTAISFIPLFSMDSLNHGWLLPNSWADNYQSGQVLGQGYRPIPEECSADEVIKITEIKRDLAVWTTLQTTKSLHTLTI